MKKLEGTGRSLVSQHPKPVGKAQNDHSRAVARVGPGGLHQELEQEIQAKQVLARTGTDRATLDPLPKEPDRVLRFQQWMAEGPRE